MSIEVFPVVEGLAEAEFFDVADWKILAHCLGLLDAAALQLRIAPLSNFICTTRREVLETLGADDVLVLEAEGELRDGVWYHGDKVLWSIEPLWFSCGEGLGCVSALIEYSKAHPEHFIDKFQAAEAVAILGEVQRILLQAQNESRRFHLKSTV